MTLSKWLARHPFFLLAVLLTIGLVALTWIGGNYVTISPQAVLPEGDDIPPGSCQSGPLYDAAGVAHPVELPYTGPAPLYRLPGDVLGVEPPVCDFPAVISPTLVTSLGAGYHPIYIEARTPKEWMRLGESTTLEASVEIGEAFRGERSLDQEATPWVAGESRQVSFSLSAPNFDYSPANDEIRPQSLGLGRTVRQLWIIAPRGDVSGQQVISIKLDDPATGQQVTFAYLWLNVRHPSGFDPVIIALIATTGLAVGWVLDRVKTVYEIRKMENELKNPRS